jgi:ribosomal protein S9
VIHYAHIENEARYQAAIDRRIKANRAKTGRAKTGRAKWLAAHEDAQTLHDWLFAQGEFDAQHVLGPRCCRYADGTYEHAESANDRYYGEHCGCKTIRHPLTAYARGDFLSKMRATIDEWGGLTDGQHAAVAKSFARAQELLAGREELRAAERAADALTSHVGTVGERRDFDLTAERTHSFDSQFGTVYITIFRDADNNVIVYKGNLAFGRGEKVRGKATIKAHDLRDGVPQTVIARPKFEEIAA